MRDLAQPTTMGPAALAAAATGLACYLRLSLWADRQFPIWYLEAVLLLGALVFWAFVFAWHQKYTGRPAFTFKPGLAPFAATTLAGIGIAAVLHWVLDPVFRRATPEDYPANLTEWAAITLFTLGFGQLLLVFAPFAFFIRLFRHRWAAAVLTVAFGVFVLFLKAGASAKPYPAPLLAALLLVRLGLGALAVFCYWRGGVLLVWWLGLLVEARHLINLDNTANTP